jgi:hypothetical protein
MKKLPLVILLLVTFLTMNGGQWTPIRSQQPVDAKVELITSNITTSEIHFSLDGFFMNEVKTPAGAAFTISVGKGTQILQQGAPDLPKLTASVIIPDQALMDMEVLGSSFIEFQDILIAPSKGNLSRNIDPSTVPYEYGRPYTENRFYPAALAELRNPYILRDYRGQTIVVNPFEYNPISRTLRVYTDITVRVFQAGSSLYNAISRDNFPARINHDFAQLYANHFLNLPETDYTPVYDYGRMLVISHGPFMQAMQPFVDWKNRMGIQTEMVDVATIGNTATAIKNYISNYYSTNGVTFVLLVGDGPQIPTNTGGNLGGPSDNAYGYLVGNDHYPDVFIGRFSAETVNHVNTMVQRTLEYEQSPSTLNDWFSKGVGIASDQGPGDDNEYDYQHIRNIRTKLMGFTYTEVAELYDGSQGGEDQSGNPTPAMVATEVNAGSSIINYCGHGSQTSWGTSGFSNSDVNQLDNNHMWPFILSVACVNGDFVSGTCFAEAWLRASNVDGPTGAVATVMSTINQSWDPPMDGQDEMDDLLVGTYPANIKRTFGGLTMNGCCQMNDDYGSGGDEMTDTWTIFGDPSVMVRTATPVILTVTHDAQVFLGSTTFTVSSPTDGALVGLTLNGQFLAAGFITGGTLTLNIPSMQNPDTLQMVVTAFNKIPYQADIPVIPNNGPYLIYNNNQIHDLAFNNNGMAEYGETVTLDLALNNIGVLPAEGVEVVLTSNDPYITLLDSLEVYPVLPAGDTTAVSDGFSFSLANNIPDLHMIPFHYVASDDTNSWSGNFTVIAHAGRLSFYDFSISDPLGNNNGKAEPGETFYVNVIIKNTGSAALINVSGQISLNDPWVTITPPYVQDYDDLIPGASASRSYLFTADSLTPNGQVVPCGFLMTADLGLSTPTSFNVIIGQIPVLVVDLDQNHSSGTVILNALSANNVSAEYEYSLPSDLSLYKTLFVCLGISSQNHVLTTPEGQQLADFLSNGGRLYMEGGDTWYYDPKTPVHAMFKANGVMDGGNDLSVENGQVGTFCDSLAFNYIGENEFIDHIAPISPAFTIFKNSSPLYITGVAYDQGNYRTIASTFEFSGLSNGSYPSTRNEYMRRIIEFFGILISPLSANFMGNPVNVCEGGTITFTNFSTGGASSWLWDFPGGNPATSTDPEPTVSYAAPGLYDVSLIAFNGQYSDTLIKPSYVWVEYCTGLSEPGQTGISIYPNPASDATFLSFGESTGEADIILTDAYARVVSRFTGIPVSQHFVLDLIGLPEGVYQLSVKTEKGLASRKLVISR